MLRVLSPAGRAAENFDELKDMDFDKVKEKDFSTENDDISEYSFKCICKKLNSELSIDENEKVYPCVMLQDRGSEIGNIDDLENGRLNMLTDAEPLIDKIAGCKECNIRYFCASNCLGLDLAIFGIEKAKHVHCDKMKNVYSAVWN